MSHSPVLLQLIVLIGSATVVATFFHLIRIPTIVGLIAAGILIGPSGLGWLPSSPNVHLFAEIAGALLLFTIGLEFPLHCLKDLRRSFISLGPIQVCATLLVIGVLVHFAAGLPWPKAILIGCLFSLSSTAVVLKLFNDSRELETPYGESCLGVLLFQDLAIIPMTLSFTFFVNGIEANGTLDLPHLGAWLIKVISIIFALFIGWRYLIPLLLEAVARTRSRELFFFCILSLCFGAGFAMELLGLSASLGAFVVGMMLSESSYGRQATSEILPFRDSFLGLFFMTVGMLVDTTFFANHVFSILSVGLITLGLKIVILFAAARALQYPAAISIITGLLLFQIGEFAFILAARAARAGLLSSDEYQYFLSISVLSMALTPLVYQFAPRFALSSGLGRLLAGELIRRGKHASAIRPVSSEPPVPASRPAQSHTIIIGFGPAGQNLAAAFKALAIPYQILEMNIETVKKFRARGEPIHFGDAAQATVLRSAGIENARLVVLGASGANMVRIVLGTIRQLRPDIEVIVRTQYFRGAMSIGRQPNTDFVVAEFETLLELLTRALRSYGVPSEKIQHFLMVARREAAKTHLPFSETFRQLIERPVFEAFSSMRPYTIQPCDGSIGQSIGLLQVRHRTGASIVSIYRDGKGMVIPDAEFVLQQNDVLHLIGEPKALEHAFELLRKPLS